MPTYSYKLTWLRSPQLTIKVDRGVLVCKCACATVAQGDKRGTGARVWAPLASPYGRPPARGRRHLRPRTCIYSYIILMYNKHHNSQRYNKAYCWFSFFSS